MNAGASAFRRGELALDEASHSAKRFCVRACALSGDVHPLGGDGLQDGKDQLMRRLTLVVALAAATWWLLAATATGGALAATPFVDISSAGPLTHVYLGNELSCQIAHTGDSPLELFPPGTIPGDCGTFITTGGILYSPAFENHGGTATGSIGVHTPFTPVSQSAVTGSGTAPDPYKVVTVADAGLTGLRVTQTDTYVIGDEAYRTVIAIQNTGNATASGILYRAGDCFLGGSDFGFGFTETFGTRKAVGCSVNANNSPAGRIEEWVPLTGGNNFFQSFYATVWGAIGSHNPFNDTCGCTTNQDNGAGVSWNFSIAAGSTSTYSQSTTFSPSGKEPLVTAKTADAGTATVGSVDGYTISVSNPNPDPVSLTSVTDTLPAGFSYVAGSTTGATTADPAVSSQTLTWAGPISVAANGSTSLHFNVHVSSTPGDYDNEAGGSAADNYTVLGTGPTARITVTAQTNHPPVCPDDSFTTNQDTPHSGSVTCTDADGNTLTYALVAGPAHGTLVFNSDGTYTYTPSSGYSGPDSFQFKANDGTADSNTATVSITVLAGDTTPPSCTGFFSGKDRTGHNTFTFLIRDTGSGLRSVEVTQIVNSTFSLPDFTVGTTDELTGVQTYIKNTKPANVDLRVTDVAGNVTDCDPLVTTVKVNRRLQAGRHTVVQTFTAVQQSESKMRIVNGRRPGLKRLRVTVNGHVFWFNRLKPGQILRYDFAKAMRPGSHNTIRIRAYGKAGASARIELSNLS